MGYKYINKVSFFISKILTPYCIQIIGWLEKFIIIPFSEWFYLTKIYIIYDTIFNWFFIRQFTILYKWYLIKDDDIRMDKYIVWVRKTFKRLRRAQDYEIEFVHHWVYLVPILILSLFYFLTTSLDFEIIIRNFIYLFYLKKLFMFVFLRHYNKNLWRAKYWNKKWIIYPINVSMRWGFWGLPLTFIKYINLNKKYNYYFSYYFNDIYNRLNFFWIVWETYYELSRLFWYLDIDTFIYPSCDKRWHSSILYRKLNLLTIPHYFKKSTSRLHLNNFFMIIHTRFFEKNFIIYKYLELTNCLGLFNVNKLTELKITNSVEYSLVFFFGLRNYFRRYYINIYTLNFYDRFLFYFRFIYNSYHFFIFISRYIICILWLVNPFLVVNPNWYKFVLPLFKELQFKYNNFNYLPTIFYRGYRVGINHWYVIEIYKHLINTYKFKYYNLNTVLVNIYLNKLNYLMCRVTKIFYQFIYFIFKFYKHNISYLYLYGFRLVKYYKFLYIKISHWFIKYWLNRLL